MLLITFVIQLVFTVWAMLCLMLLVPGGSPGTETALFLIAAMVGANNMARDWRKK